jgi:hypothetical protein
MGCPIEGSGGKSSGFSSVTFEQWVTDWLPVLQTARLGLTVVAEGVESPKPSRNLSGGCRQGRATGVGSMPGTDPRG